MFKRIKKPITTKQTKNIVSLVNKCQKTFAIAALIGMMWSYIPWTNIHALTQGESPVYTDEVVMSDYPTTTDVDFDPSSIALQHEVFKERTSASKTFRKVDGTFETALYDQNIHYFEDSEWKQIDNSLSDLGSELENKHNKFKIKFPKFLDDNKSIKFTENNYGVNWSVLNIESSNISYDDSEIQPISIKELSGINQSIKYNNIQDGVDIEYVLSGDKLKENIILNKYIGNFSLSFEYKLKNLSIILNSDNKYVFINDSNEVIYEFVDLFMFDNDMNYSEDLNIMVTETGNKTYEIVITPNDKWLKNAIYPIIIDPVFEDPDPDPTYNNSLIRDKETSDAGIIETSYTQRVGSYNSKNYKTYIEIDFSSIPDDTIITYSHLLVGTYINPTTTCANSNGCVVEVRKVNQDSDWSDITNSSFSDVESFIEDYNIITDNMGIRRWDVSKALYDWHTDFKNIGIFELSIDTGPSDNYVSFASETYSLITGPNVIIGYQSTTGLHSFWTYHSAPAGDAGTIMINDFTGELNLVRNDYTGNHSGMTIDLGMFYSENLKDTNIGYGLGWRTNFNSTAYYDSPDYEVVSPSGSTTRYEQVMCSDVTDEPEIRNYSLDCYLANDGSRQILVEDDYDNDSSDEIIIYSTDRVRTIYESGQFSKIEDLKTGYFLEMSYNANNQISKISDHYGNYITLEYDANDNLEYELVQLCQTWDVSDYCTQTNLVEVVEFIYSSSADASDYNLTNVDHYMDYSGTTTYTNITSSSHNDFSVFMLNAKNYQFYYTYDDNSGEDDKLLSAKSSTDVLVEIEYGDNNKAEKYEFTKGSSKLGFVDIIYNNYETLFTDYKGNQVRYTFDSYGHTVNILDDYGYATFYRYLNAFSDTINTAGNKFLHHKLVESSLPQKTQLNPIANHSFEFGTAPAPGGTDTNWSIEIDSLGGATSSSGISSGYYDTESVFGTKSARIIVNTAQEAHIEQTIVLDEGEYTFSGFIKTSGSNAYIDVVNETTTIDSAQRTATGDGEWDYVEYTFTVASDNTSIELKLCNYSSGTSYYDNFQVLEAFIDTRVNILDNPSFESNTTGWTLSGVTRVANNVETIEGDLHDSILGDYSIEITGDPLTRKYFETTLTNNEFITEQNYIIAGWSKGDISAITSNLNGEDDKVYGILVTLSNGTTTEDIYFPFNSDIENWQYQASKFYVESDITTIKIKVMFQGEGTVLFDGLQAYNEGFGTRYKYDNFGNTTEILKPSKKEPSKFSYNDDNQRFELLSIEDSDGNVSTPSFDSSGLFENLIHDNIASSVVRNSEGQIEEVVVGVDDDGDGVFDDSYYQSFISYTTDHQYIDKTTDSFGNDVDFLTELLTGLLEQTTNENAVAKTFEYDEYGRVIEVTKDNTTNSYLYEEDLLIEISVNGTTYKLSYDTLNRLETVEVGTGTSTYFNGTMLKEFVYDTDYENGISYESNRIKEEGFGNGDRIKLTYNDEDQIEGIWFYETNVFVKRYNYEYNQSGAMAILNDLRDDQQYYFNYDSSGRLRKVTNQEGDVTSYEYDDSGNIHIYIYDIQGYERNTIYEYDYTNDLYDKTVTGDLTKDYIYIKDGVDDPLDRLRKITFTLFQGEANQIAINNISIVYFEGTEVANGDISHRVKSISQTINGTNYVQTLEYGTDGIIRKITDSSSNTTDYTYDNKDQLIREDNEVNNQTIVYEYDNYGNRDSRKIYNYSIDSDLSSHTILSSEDYTYKTIWDDQIDTISYYLDNDLPYVQTYSYDDSGNLIKIEDSRELGVEHQIQYVYEGRSLTKVGTVDSYSLISSNHLNPLGFDFSNGFIFYENLDTVSSYTDYTLTLPGSTRLPNMEIFISSSSGQGIWNEMPEYANDCEYDSYYDIHMCTFNTGPYESIDINIVATGIETYYNTYGTDQWWVLEEGLYFNGPNSTFDYSIQYKYTNYTYNQAGIRDSKTSNGVTTTYYLDGTRVLYETDGTNEIYYTYDVDGSLLSMIYNNVEYYYVFNVFGDVIYLVDSSGSIVVEYTYDAYGNIVFQTNSTLSKANPYRYRGYRYDEDTNLYYLQSRYYNPETGRFINADGMLKASNTVLGHNMFAYTENNPVMNVDPTGYAVCLASSPSTFKNYSCVGGGGGGRKHTLTPINTAFKFTTFVSSNFFLRIIVSWDLSSDMFNLALYGGGDSIDDSIKAKMIEKLLLDTSFNVQVNKHVKNNVLTNITLSFTTGDLKYSIGGATMNIEKISSGLLKITIYDRYDFHGDAPGRANELGYTLQTNRMLSTYYWRVEFYYEYTTSE